MKSSSNKKLNESVAAGRGGVVFFNKTTTTPKSDAHFYGYKTYIKVSHGGMYEKSLKNVFNFFFYSFFKN